MSLGFSFLFLAHRGSEPTSPTENGLQSHGNPTSDYDYSHFSIAFWPGRAHFLLFCFVLLASNLPPTRAPPAFVLLSRFRLLLHVVDGQDPGDTLSHHLLRPVRPDPLDPRPSDVRRMDSNDPMTLRSAALLAQTPGWKTGSIFKKLMAYSQNTPWAISAGCKSKWIRLRSTLVNLSFNGL